MAGGTPVSGTPGVIHREEFEAPRKNARSIVAAMSSPKDELTDTSAPDTDDRQWCLAVLPRVSRTFALNIRLLGPALREPVALAYLLCRAADTIEDAWPGSPAEIRDRFDRFLAAVDGQADASLGLAHEASTLPDARDDHRLLAGLPRLIAAWRELDPDQRRPVREALGVMVGGMSRYASRAAERGAQAPYVDTEAELHDYCWVVAGCVGVMLTRLFEPLAGPESPHAAAERLRLAPVVGEALQLTNVLLDWPRDIRRGRCYLPAEWLREHGLSPAELVGRERASVVALSARLESLARSALARVPDYLEHVPARHVRYRVFCLWPALWALASLRRARRDSEFPWGSRRPRLARGDLFGTALGSLPVLGSDRGVRRLFAAL